MKGGDLIEGEERIGPVAEDITSVVFVSGHHEGGEEKV
jgi:hypothetical protein